MSTLLQDHFTDANGTSLAAHAMDVGAGWRNDNGTWTIQSNRAVEVATATAIASADAGHSDVTLTLDFVVPNVNNYTTGAVGRLTDKDNCFIVGIERDSGGTPFLLIVSRIAGVQSLLANANIAGATNTTVTLTITFAGNLITVTANTGETCNATNTFNNTATRFGLFSYTGSGYFGGPLDNFLVTGTAAVAATQQQFMLLGMGS